MDSQNEFVAAISERHTRQTLNGEVKMNNNSDNTLQMQEENILSGRLYWISTGELARFVKISDSHINHKLKNGQHDDIRSLDKRILDIKKEPSKGRGGFRWRFLWQDDGLKRSLRVGYFSTLQSEGQSAVTARRKGIAEFAKNTGISLNSIEFDVIGRSDLSQRKLATLINHPLLELIVTDQEFSLGGVHCDFIKQIIFSAGIQIVVVPGLYRSAHTVQESYMSEISRLLLKLQLLGAPLDDLAVQLSERFRFIRSERERLQNDPGIT